MGNTRDTGFLRNLIAYDASGNITLPGNLTVTGTLTGYATSASLGSYVPTSRTITINGTTFDLTANRNWDIISMIYPAAGIPLSTGSAWGTSITNNSANWNTAYGWGNHASAGYLTSISSLDVVTALGYAPYNGTTNPNGYITGISFANVSAKPTTLAGYGITDAVPSARTITINGTTWDLSANRSWTVTVSETDTLATVTSRGASTSTPVVFSGNMAAWNTTTPGTGLGTVQIGAANGTANTGGAITFAARDGGGGSNAHAGIYINSDGAYGTRMYIATTDSYAAGSKTAISISETGVVNFVRANATVQGNGLIHAGNIGSQSVASASNSTTTSQRDFNYLRINSNNHLYLDYNYGQSIIGVYSASRYQGVFSMGAAYVLPLDGTGPGNLYGMAWSHPNAGGQAGYLNDHGLLVMVNGVTYAAISSNIWARGNITANGQFNGSGAGLSGTASSLTAGAANSVAWGNVSGRPGWMTSASLIESHSNANEWRNSGFYENGGGGSNWPSQTWYNSVNVRHSNQGNYHGFQIAMSYYDNNLWFRSYQGSGTFQSWIYAISSANIGSQSVNYSSTAGSTGSLSANASANNIYNSGWFRNYGDTGLYNQDYGCHVMRNSQSSHGSWSIWGYTKAGYVGMNLQDPSGYNNNLMYEGGNGGMYTQNGNGWQWYYNLGSNCIGLGGSTTYNWVRAVVNGKLKIESDSIHTGWAYFDSNTQLAGGGNTLYNEYNYWYVWRNWGGWGGEWINRNGGDMIMNLYAVYAVTGSVSDIRYKKEVTPVTYGLNEIMRLNPIKYKYNMPKESMLANDPDFFLGFSAQEVQGIIPEAVHEKMDSNNKDGMLAITYDELIPVLVNGIKEQQVMIHNQNIKINKLESLVNQLLNN